MDLSNFPDMVSTAFNKGMLKFMPAKEAIHLKAEITTEKEQSKKIEDFER